MNYNIDQFTYNGDTYNFVDNVRQRLNGVQNGTDLSWVTTGEKYTWDNKSNLTIGNSATTAAAGNHTHTTTLATDTGTSTLTLASAGKYKLTAGDTSVIFTMPTIPTNVSAFTNDAQYLTASTNAYTNSIASTIQSSDISNWNNKGTVKSISVNNGTAQTPDANGKVNLTISGGGGGTSDTASYLNVPSEAGYQTDDYGNLLHKRSNTDDSFNLKSYGTDGTDRTTTLKMYFDNGNITTPGTILSTNNTNDEVFGAGSSSYRYHISVGSRYLRVRDSGVDGTAPSTSNISSTLVLSPVALNIIDGWNTSSGNYTLRAALSNNELRFLNSSNSYSVTPTKITSWDTAASKTAGIGTVHTSSGTKSNIPSSGPSTYYEFANFSVLPGKWLIMITARFPSNSAGERAVCLSTSSATTGINAVRDTDIRVPISGNPTFCKVTTIYNNSGSTNQTLYINGYQNSGSSTAMTVSYGYHAIKISN